MNILSDDEIKHGCNLPHFDGTQDEDESHQFAMLAEDILESNVLGKVMNIKGRIKDKH